MTQVGFSPVAADCGDAVAGQFVLHPTNAVRQAKVRAKQMENGLLMFIWLFEGEFNHGWSRRKELKAETTNIA